MTKEWLDLRNIDIFYKKNPAIKNINLKLAIGENTVIIGPNGSGKSTLIKLIARMVYPIVKEDSHLKIFDSSNINIWELRSKVGFLFSDINLRIKPHMQVIDVILSGYQGTYGLINKNLISSKNRCLAENLIEKLGLKYIDKYYTNLSDGQKRRVLIARALINNPKVLVLDEPTNLLDVKSSYQLLENLSYLAKEGVTILYVTNNIENIIQEIDRVLFIKDGKIINDGCPSKILNSKNISNLYDYSMKILNIDGFWRIRPKNN